jgi:hypothetical protein
MRLWHGRGEKGGGFLLTLGGSVRMRPWQSTEPAAGNWGITADGSVTLDVVCAIDVSDELEVARALRRIRRRMG